MLENLKLKLTEFIKENNLLDQNNENFNYLFDENKELNNYGLYVMASRAKFDFKNLILSIGTSGKEYKVNKKEVKVQKEEDLKELNNKFYNIKKLYLEKMELFKDNNSDYYYERLQVRTVKPYVENFKFNTENLTIEDAIQGYKLANYILNELKEFEDIKTVKVRILKPEYKDLYEEYKLKVEKETGYSESLYKEELEKISFIEIQDTYRLSLNRKQYENEDSFMNLSKQLLLSIDKELTL